MHHISVHHLVIFVNCCYEMVNYGIWEWCATRYVQQVFCVRSLCCGVFCCGYADKLLQSLLVLYWLLCLGCCFYFNHLPMMFLSTDFAFRITDWTCCHGPHLHAILRIITRGVSGWATDSPCGVWGRGWTTCLLHDSPLFGSHFKMSWYVSLEWYFMHLLFLASVHGFMHETSEFFTL